MSARSTPISISGVPVSLQNYQPPLSLWSLVEENVTQYHEQQEIKRILGESLVDQSLELHEEVNTLFSILEDVNEQSSAASPLTLPVLAEPPEQRQRLVQEICFFVENVREKANCHGKNPERLLGGHNNYVIDYAIKQSRPGSSLSSSRPSTASSSSRVSSPFNTSRLEDKHGKRINYLTVDDVLKNLRTSLEEEIEFLLQDISILQQSIDDAMSMDPTDGLQREPTLTELKEERAALEKELLTPDNYIPEIPNQKKTIFEIPNQKKNMFKSKSLSAGSGVSSRGPVKPRHIETEVNAEGLSSKGKYDYSAKILTTNRMPSVIKRSGSRDELKLIPLGTLRSADGECFSPEGKPVMSPSPPPVRRPSSADRFRKLVVDCREVT